MEKALSKKNANIILITIDCLRTDHLSCNGYWKNTSPFIDELSKNGLNFIQTISNSCWTPPSFASLLTSTYPLMYDGYVSITKDRIPIAEILKNNGYICGAFTENFLLIPIYNYDRGFHYYYQEPKEIKNNLAFHTKLYYALIKKFKKNFFILRVLLLMFEVINELRYIKSIIFSYPKVKKGANFINEKAFRWLESIGNKKFFLWIHYIDVHQPYLPPLNYLSNKFNKFDIGMLHLKRGIVNIFNNPNFLSKKDLNSLINLYDLNINHVDYQIGKLLQRLEKIIDIKNTYIIISSDHGEGFLEHGKFGHGLMLYEEFIHVPLIISGPNLPSKKIDLPVSLIDLAPTILNLVDIKVPLEYIGHSLLKKIKTNNKSSLCFTENAWTSNNKCFYDEPGKIKLDINHRIIAVRDNIWKYIYNEGGIDELYNIENDPKERKNLIVCEKNKAKELKLKIQEHMINEKTFSIKGKSRREINRLKINGKI